MTREQLKPYLLAVLTVAAIEALMIGLVVWKKLG
jgi:hypothetical protein